MDMMEILWRFGWFWALLLNLFLLWVSWSLGKKFVTRKDCDNARVTDAETRKRFGELLDKHERALAEVTVKIDNLPSIESTHEMSLKLARIEGDQRALSIEVKGLRDILERVENQVSMIVRGHLRTE